MSTSGAAAYEHAHADRRLIEAVYNETHRGWRWDVLTSGEQGEYIGQMWWTICAAANAAIERSS